jgi:hypothetical protein
MFTTTFHSTLLIGKALPALSQKNDSCLNGLRTKKTRETITLCGV